MGSIQISEVKYVASLFVCFFFVLQKEEEMKKLSREHWSEVVELMVMYEMGTFSVSMFMAAGKRIGFIVENLWSFQIFEVHECSSSVDEQQL